MKSYTDISQSKKLKEILPLESADMRYGYIAPYEFSDRMYDGGYDDVPYPKDFLKKNPNFSVDEYDAELPCWSLAALLEIIKKPTALDLLINGRGYRCHCTDKSEGKFYGTDDYCDNAIDACVEIIEKLYEQKFL